MISLDKLYEIFEDSINLLWLEGEAESKAGMSERQYAHCLKLYRETKNNAGMLTQLEPERYPILAEKIREVMPEKETRKHGPRLTPIERLSVYEAMQVPGATRAKVGERFGISTALVSVICKENRGKPEASPFSLSVVEPEPVVELKPEQTKIAGDEDAGIFFEGEYMIIKVLRSKVTRSLLSAVL